MNGGNLTMAFNFSRQPRSTPKQICWNLLAAAYIGLRQNDDAVAALKKQSRSIPTTSTPTTPSAALLAGAQIRRCRRRLQQANRNQSL